MPRTEAKKPAEKPRTKIDRRALSWPERIRRYAVCLAGIFFISFGVALFTKSGTGTSAISVVPYTLSLMLTQLSYGTWVALFNIALALVQLPLLRKDADRFDIGQQVFFSLIFGSIVDLSMWILTYFNPSEYWQCFITMLVSIPVLAMGAYLTLISRVGVLPGDGFARSVSQVSGVAFAKVRVTSDSIMVLTGAIMCLAAWGALITVREGTILAALFTGTVVGFYTKHLKKLEYALVPTNKEVEQAERQTANVPEENFIVTVSRTYGSGGRQVGRIIADRLGVPCYDAAIINLMARNEGLDPRYVAQHEQQLDSSARESFYRWYAGTVPQEDLPEVEKLYHAQQRVIRQLAAEGSCVIVGRLANYILRDHENHLDLFVHADEADAVARVMEREGLDAQEAAEKIRTVNHKRSEHCRYFAHRAWDNARYYDETVNTSRYGVERAGQMMADLAASVRK